MLFVPYPNIRSTKEKKRLTLPPTVTIGGALAFVCFGFLYLWEAWSDN